jgi:cyclopropane fatty-acyl-phospholipid synthase-like methyltransferase
LDGVEAKLARGAQVADVGCGQGASTIPMAKAFPRSRFLGFDYHAPSIRRAREVAAAENVAGNATFEVATAKDFPGRDYDLIAGFDCLHDMGDPKGAAAHIRNALQPDGIFMLVEPFARDDLEDNLTRWAGCTTASSWSARPTR